MAALPKKELPVSHTHTCTHTHSHPNPSTLNFTSGKKDAFRCFHEAELHYTASVLHEKRHRQWNGEVMLYPCGRPCVFLSACAQFCVSARESIITEWEREPGAASQGLFTSAGALVWDTIPTSAFGLFPTWTERIPFRVLGGEMGSHQHQRLHRWFSRSGEEAIHFLIAKKLLCHSGRELAVEKAKES